MLAQRDAEIAALESAVKEVKENVLKRADDAAEKSAASATPGAHP